MLLGMLLNTGMHLHAAGVGLTVGRAGLLPLLLLRLELLLTCGRMHLHAAQCCLGLLLAAFGMHLHAAGVGLTIDDRTRLLLLRLLLMLLGLLLLGLLLTRRAHLRAAAAAAADSAWPS